ncbi:MAG TPA: lytic transglycosylase domain-containing protein [Candidatus Saccharicenans sp.]|jgi:soluble lytic murein transglycosylase-like protein|nr:lytic transglycosylase domain-containing protein [Candidatus Saccharicenans sp.]HOL45919.1 lytic transglycosylase domain-containing protein [Candidatus Saccharicenans sp.]HOM93718.1 lytic transglycosylase domain-containing protein [Candidatus Saccharicenans sp.]HOP61627.1 lytic transglycosylase domain-containing protein [Candidatus Saccharicenans sp.]HOT68431.1 lytic transglycosylase domain-containing protein [Candidatus Saccharicenans sp.]
MDRKRVWLVGLVSSLIFLFSSSQASTRQEELKAKYDAIIQKKAAKHGLPAELIHAVIKAESNYDQFAVSDKGALGLMQLMPETAIRYGVMNVFDPEQNIEGGVKYLKDLVKLYKGDRNLVLAAYNAGQQAVDKHNGVPPYSETKNYLKRVEYKSPYIKTKTIIYRYYDENGQICLTNNPYYLPPKKTS